MERKWTLANAITTSGFFGIALYIYGSVVCNIAYILWGLSFALLTDLVDGKVARRLNQKTNLGAILDPVRDRVILFAFFFQLWNWNYFSDIRICAFVGVAMLFELGIWSGRFFVQKLQGVFVKTNWIGKLRQAVHTVCMSAIVLGISLFADRNPVFMYPALALIALVSVIAFAGYYGDAMAQMKRSVLRKTPAAI